MSSPEEGEAQIFKSVFLVVILVCFDILLSGVPGIRDDGHEVLIVADVIDV